MAPHISSKKIMTDPKVLALSISIMSSVARANGATEEAPVQIDAQTAMEALLLAYSMTLALHPNAQTKSGIRVAADDAGTTVKVLLTSLRAYHEDHGVPFIEHIGMASDPVMRRPDAETVN